jgi:hypothetical protein
MFEPPCAIIAAAGIVSAFAQIRKSPALAVVKAGAAQYAAGS